MKKTKQYITNSSMFLILFFVLFQQSSRILSLSIGINNKVQSDITFYIILITAVSIITTLLYLIPNLLILELASYVVSFNQPVLTSYHLNKRIIKMPVINTKRSYKTLQVIRC